MRANQDSGSILVEHFLFPTIAKQRVKSCITATSLSRVLWTAPLSGAVMEPVARHPHLGKPGHLWSVDRQAEVRRASWVAVKWLAFDWHDFNQEEWRKHVLLNHLCELFFGVVEDTWESSGLRKQSAASHEKECQWERHAAPSQSQGEGNTGERRRILGGSFLLLAEKKLVNLQWFHIQDSTLSTHLYS